MDNYRISDFIKLQPKQMECYKLLNSGKRIFFGGARGGGKLSPLDSIVYTPFGPREMGDLKVGDTIFNPNGSPQKVIAIHPHKNVKIYRMYFDDDSSLEVGEDHLWLTWLTSGSTTKVKDNEYLNDEQFGDGRIMTTTEVMKWIDKKIASEREQHLFNQHLCIPLSNPMQFTKSYKYDMRKIPPYVLGVLIGDGSLSQKNGLNSISYTGLDDEIGDRIREYGYEVIDNGKNHIIKGQQIALELKRVGLLGTTAIHKFIPKYYKYSSVEQRKELLQGLMDTDGYVDSRGHMSYTTISEELAKDVQYVVWSLGGKAKITKGEAGYRDASGEYIQCNDAYTVWINTKFNADLVYLTRKKLRTREGFNGGISELRRRFVRYEYVGRKDARCITVSHPNGLYVANDFIVTHNSHLALAACMLLCLQYPGIRCIIVRKHFSELEELFIQKVIELYPEDIFGYKYRAANKTCTFSNGSRIIFRAAEREEDVNKVKGLEYQFMVIDEANEFDEMAIHKFLGSLRNAHIPGYTPTLLMTGNPGGKSDLFFKTRFINPDPKRWNEFERENIGMYVFIEAKLEHNSYLMKDQNYVNNLRALPDALRAAWLDGNWDIFDGQFFEEFQVDVHVVDEFAIPKEWDRYGGIDIGSSKDHPTVYLRAAQDPRDLTIYVYGEYSCSGSVEQAIYDIKEIEEEDEVPRKLMDPSAFGKNLQKTYGEMSVAQMFLNEGIPVERANNERVNGWRILKAWLHWRTTRKPKLRIMRNCQGLIRTLPQLRYDGAKKVHAEDLDTTMADDYADALRYMIVTVFGMPLNSMVAENDIYYKGIEEENKKYYLDEEEIFSRFAATEYADSVDDAYSRFSYVTEELSWV